MENRINNGRRIIIGLLVILFLYDAFKYNQIGGPNFEISTKRILKKGLNGFKKK